MPSCDDRAAVDVDTHIGVDSGISAERAGLRCHGTSVDNQPSVGVNSVALAGLSCHKNMEFTAVYGRYRNTVFVGVDAVVAGIDADDAAVYR